MQLDFQFDGCLIRIETDAGLVGYGETGTNAAMAIERHFLPDDKAPASLPWPHRDRSWH